MAQKRMRDAPSDLLHSVVAQCEEELARREAEALDVATYVEQGRAEAAAMAADEARAEQVAIDERIGERERRLWVDIQMELACDWPLRRWHAYCWLTAWGDATVAKKARR